MPHGIPLWPTIVGITLTNSVQMSALNYWLIAAYLFVAWLVHFAQRIYGMPVDIFEYFRKEDSEAHLPIEPQPNPPSKKP